MQRNNPSNNSFASQKVKRNSTLHVVFDAMEEPAFIMDRQGTIIDANKAIALLVGKTVDECITANAYDFLPPELAAIRRKKVEQVFRTGRRMIF